jgi:hypothetical protein
MSAEIKHLEFALEKTRNGLAMPYDRERVWQLALSGRAKNTTNPSRSLEMAESSPDRYTYERKFVSRFGGQQELELVVPSPKLEPPHAERTAVIPSHQRGRGRQLRRPALMRGKRGYPA